MCGILLALSKNEPLDAHRCRRALSSMNWRGPDFSYSHIWNDRLFLGQTVLSMTGKPEKEVGHYHLSHSKRYELYYNGEIYNYRELRRHLTDEPWPCGTDTEILVNLHEKMNAEKIPALLDGMYAYAVFDMEKKLLHLCRDPQGEKSLYIYEDSNQVLIASSIPAIRMMVPSLSLDHQSLRNYFSTRHLMLFEKTVYQNIREILPGAMETLDLQTLQWSRQMLQPIRQWIDPEKYRQNNSRTIDSLVDELDSLLNQCVTEMLPDGRVYSSILSGGIDSSLISHYVVKNGHPNILVAVNHVGKDRISNKLTPFEKILNKKVDVLHVDSARYAAEIERCQRACGGPLPVHSFVPQSIQCAYVKSSDSRVLFGGDAADEYFGGYPAYLERRPSDSPYSPSPYTELVLSPVEFLKNDSQWIKDQLAAAWQDGVRAYSFIEEDSDRAALAMMYCDAVYQLPSVGLRGSDLMAMMWSVEMRSVFLRKPILQFALNLPLWAKISRDPKCPTAFQSKILLKKLFARYFGSPLIEEKQGFGGFPNESATYLGKMEDYQVVEMLGIIPSSLPQIMKNQAAAWKMINLEYFLRNIQ